MTTQKPNRTSGYVPVNQGISKDTLAQVKEMMENPQNPEEETPATPELTVTDTPEDKTDWKKRFSDQSTHLNNIAAEAKAAKEERDRLRRENEQLLAQQTARKQYAADDVVEKFENEFDDVAPVIKQIAAKLTDERIEEVKKDFQKTLDEKDAKLRKQNEDSQKLSAAHPDWAKIKESDEFKQWYAAQSPVVHELGNFEIHQNMDKIILVLDMFKRDVGLKAAKPAKSQDSRELQRVPSSSPAETPKAKDLLSYSKWKRELEQAQKLSQKDKQAKLIVQFEEARKEGRLTN